MESNRSWSIDDQRNKFQFGCEYARKIENGRLTTPLKNPNYRANHAAVFGIASARLGDGSTLKVFGTPYLRQGRTQSAGSSGPCLTDLRI